MSRFTAVHIVPTGVGAEIGGYVGDATPATNTLASICDTLISHPNVVNGVSLDVARKNVLYVEGYSLDRLLDGQIGLREVTSNKIGIVLDRGMDDESYELALNTIDAIRAVKGVNVLGYVKTEKNVGCKAVKTKSGAFTGEISNEDVMLKACWELINKGVDAIALSLSIETSEKDLKKYFKGKGPNPYGGTEAVISHLVSREFKIPCAHAPLLSPKEIHKEMHSGVVDPRAAAEAIGPAYLGCVLQGLSNAPRIVPYSRCTADEITYKDINALVLPYSCMGGIPALAAQKFKIPIIAVKENKTLMKLTPEKMKFKNVYIAENYWEAAGILAAMKEGIDPKELRRPIEIVKKL